MTRTADETAGILIGLYDESFAGESGRPFRIGWPELRSVAGVERLSDDYLWGVDECLKEEGYFLFPLDTFLVVAMESDLSPVRAVPPRIIEKCLPGEDDEFDEDDLELLGSEQEEDDDDEFEGMEVFGMFSAEGSPGEESPSPKGAAAPAAARRGRPSRSAAPVEPLSE